MKYDLKIHIPQQLENMLTAENEGNLALFEKSVGNLVEMIDEPGFKIDIDEYNKKKETGIDQVKSDFMEIAVKVKENGYDEFVGLMDQAQQGLSADTLEVVREYMNQVKTYIFSYVKNIDVKTL